MEEKLSRTLELNSAKVQALKELNYSEINEKNAAEFNISGIDGVLVGGASLDAERFAAIVRSF